MGNHNSDCVLCKQEITGTAVRCHKCEAPHVPIEINEEYEALAMKVGFESAELIGMQILALFKEQNIRLYRERDVYAWLAKEMKKKNVSEPWRWRPLRERDVIEPFGWNLADGKELNGYYNSKDWECRPYARLIPLSTLRTVEMIDNRFGDKVKFFVSDAGKKIKDTFIMVRSAICNDCEEDIIFDLWIQELAQ